LEWRIFQIEMINSGTAVQFCWSVLGLYWFYSALGTKKTAVNENPALRVVRLSILAVTLALLLTDWLRIGPLAQRFMPRHSDPIWFGVGLTAAGVALAIWARWNLGRNWSDKVVLKVDQGKDSSREFRRGFRRLQERNGLLSAWVVDHIQRGPVRICVLPRLRVLFRIQLKHYETIDMDGGLSSCGVFLCGWTGSSGRRRA
jgi:hypothetical protein